MRTMKQMQAAAKWDTGFAKPESEPPVRVQPVVSPYDCCDMTTLSRLIKRDHDDLAYETWKNRYGHDFPVYAIINGEELKCQE